jgi:hypothetical protein
VGSAIAQALFEKGRAAMQRGEWAQACPQLAESLRLEPTLGTLLNLALCHESEGRLATAYVEYTDATAKAVRERDAEREAIARERALALSDRIPRLTIESPSPSPAGLWVSLDGVRLGTETLGVPLPIDPGPHSLSYGATHRVTQSRTFVATAGAGSLSLELAELASAPPTRPLARRPSSSFSPLESPRRMLAAACWGSAAAALGFGAYAGMQAGAEWHERNRHCPGGTCDDAAAGHGADARRFALISNVSFGFGLAAAGLGAYLWLTGKPEAPTSIRVQARLDGRQGLLGVEGRF